MARQMKDSGIAWIGEIPAEWAVCKQKHLIKLLNGRAYSDDEFEVDGKYKILRVGNLFSNPVWYTSSLELEPEKYCEAGDLLYAWSMSYAPVIWNGEKVIYHYHIWKTALSSKLIKEFAYYYFISLTDALMAEKHQTTMSFVTMGVMNNSYIAYPDVSEQHRIADFLDTECARIDAVIEKTRASIEEYKKLKQAVITEAVTKGIRPGRKMKLSEREWIREYPEGWKEIKIKWLLSERKERSEQGTEEPLSMSQKYGLIPTKEMDMVPNMASSFVGAKIVHEGDLVFNKLKAHLGVFSVSGYSGLVSPDYAVYFSTGEADVDFLEYLFKTPQYIGEFKKKSSGVGVGLTRLYTDDLYSIYCALPELDEQRRIVAYLDEKVIEIEFLAAKKELLISELEFFKKSLIFEYVTGKKEVE